MAVLSPNLVGVWLQGGDYFCKASIQKATTGPIRGLKTSYDQYDGLKDEATRETSEVYVQYPGTRKHSENSSPILNLVEHGQ